MSKVAQFYCVHALADAEHVAGFKLLGVLITSDLKWNTHTLIKFVQNPPRLYFLKQMKWAGLAADQL